MKYLIFSKINCLIKIKEQNFEIDEDSYLELDSPEDLLIYPLEKHYLPTILKLKKENVTKMFDEYKIYQIDFQMIHSNGQYLIKNFNGRYATLSVKPYVFTISDSSSCYTYKIFDDIQNPEIISINGAPALQGTLNDDDYLLVFSNNDFIKIVGDIEIERNKIIAIEKCLNIAKHGRRLEIELNGTKSKFVSNELLYLKNKPIIPKNTGAKNFAFLQAIMYKDYDLARTFLNENLSKKLSDEHFLKFFGSFDNIIAICNEKFILFEKNTPKGVFELKNINGKIVDVT